MAPRPAVELRSIPEEEEEGTTRKSDGLMINGTNQNRSSDFSDLRGSGHSHKNSRPVAANNSQVNISGGDSFVEGEDSKSKYRYIFYSPSLDIFNRVHQVFQTMPEIHQNLLEAEKEKLEKRRKKK